MNKIYNMIYFNSFFYIFFLLSSLAISQSFSDLVINELMVSNDSALVDEFGEYDDWIELYNKGNEPINLNGLHLSDDLSDLSKYTFPNIILNPNSYLIIWADDQNTLQGEMHADFKLSSFGETLYLSDSQLNVLSEVTWSMISSDVGYARVPNGIGDFVVQDFSFASSNDLIFNLSEQNNDKQLIKVVNIFGNEVIQKKTNSVLFEIYNDKSVKKIIYVQ